MSKDLGLFEGNAIWNTGSATPVVGTREASTPPKEYEYPESVSQWNDLVDDVSLEYPFVPKGLVKSIIKQESGGNPRATGVPTKYGTAKGLGQFIDETARKYVPQWNSSEDSYDPEKNIRGMYAYLDELIQKNDGSINGAVRDYFGHGADPTGKTTEGYEGEVIGRFEGRSPSAKKTTGLLDGLFEGNASWSGEQAKSDDDIFYDFQERLYPKEQVDETVVSPKTGAATPFKSLAVGAADFVADIIKGTKYENPMMKYNPVMVITGVSPAQELIRKGIETVTPGFFDKASQKIRDLISPETRQEVETAVSGKMLPKKLSDIPEFVQTWTSLVAQQAPQLATQLAGPLPSAATLVTQQKGQFINEAEKIGIPEKQTRKYSDFYAVPAGISEYADNVVVLAKRVPGLSKVTDAIKNKIASKIAHELGAASFEGTQEFGQNYLQSFMLGKAAKEAGMTEEQLAGKIPQASARDFWAGFGIGAVLRGAAAAGRKTAEVMTRKQGQVEEPQNQTVTGELFGDNMQVPSAEKPVAEKETKVGALPQNVGALPQNVGALPQPTETGKTLSEFGVDEKGFNALPQDRQNEIYGQLSEPERDRLISFEEEQPSIEDVRRRVQEVPREDEVEAEEVSNVELEPKEVNATEKQIMRAREYASKIAGVSFKGEYPGFTNPKNGEVAQAPLLMFNDDQNEGTTITISPDQGIDELRRKIEASRKNATIQQSTSTMTSGELIKEARRLNVPFSLGVEGIKGPRSQIEKAIDIARKMENNKKVTATQQPVAPSVKSKKEVIGDQENVPRIPGEERIGEKPVETRPVERGGEGTAPGGGILQKEKKLKDLFDIPLSEVTGNRTSRSSTNFFNDVFEGKSRTPEAYGQLDIPSRLNVLSRVIRTIENNKVMDDIIPFIPINVVNNLIRTELSSDVSFHDNPMLIRDLAIRRPSSVIPLIIEGIKNASTRSGAKGVDSFISGRGSKIFSSAVTADELIVPEIPSMFHDINIQENETENKEFQTQTKMVEENREFNEKQNRLDRLAKRKVGGGRGRNVPRRPAATRRSAPDEEYDTEYRRRQYAHGLNTEFYNAMRFGWKKSDGTKVEGSKKGWTDDYNIVSDRNEFGGSKNPSLSENAKQYLKDVAHRIGESPELLDELDKMGIKRPENGDDIRELIAGSYNSSEFVGYHNSYERELARKKGSEHKGDELNKALAVFNNDPGKVTPEQKAILEDYFQAPFDQVVSDYGMELTSREENQPAPAETKPTKEMKPSEWKQQDIFGKEKSTSEIEAEEKKRLERAEIKERIERRRGGEADVSNLPLFEDADIEGSQSTLKFAKGKVSEVQPSGKTGQFRSKAEADLAAVIYKKSGKPPRPEAVQFFRGKQTPEIRRVKAFVEQATSKQVIFIETDSEAMYEALGYTIEGLSIAGSQHPSFKNKIFIDVNAKERTLMWVGFHEFAHFIEQDKGLSARFWNAVKLTTKGDKAWEDVGNTSEFQADIIGEMMSRPEFWQHLEDQGRGTVERVIREFIRIIGKVLSAFKRVFTGNKVPRKAKYEEYVTDVQGLMKELSSIYTEYRNTEGKVEDAPEKLAAAMQPQFAKGKKRLPILPKTIPTPTKEQVAEAKEAAAKEANRVKMLEKEMRSLRKELKGIQENLLMSRAEIGIKLKTVAEARIDEVRNAIYDYAKAIGLSGVPYNKVDLMLKNATSAAGLRKAVSRLDDIWRNYEKRAVYMTVLDRVEKEYRRLAKITAGKAKSTIAAEYNNRLKTYLDSLKTKPDWFEGDNYYELVDKMLNYYNMYAPKDVKKAESVYDLPENIQRWMDDPTAPVPEELKNMIQAMFRPALSTMTTEQLRGVITDIDNLKEWGKTVLEMREDERREKLDDAATRIARQIILSNKKRPKHPLGEATERGVFVEHRYLGDLIKKSNWSLIDNERQVEWMVGWEDVEDIKEMIQYKFYDAESKKLVAIEDAQNNFEENHKGIDWAEAIKKPWISIDLKSIHEKNGVVFGDVDENGIVRPYDKEYNVRKISLDNGMFFYANTKNPGNLAHMRGCFATVEIADEIIDLVVKALPQKYKDAVDAQIRYYDNTQWKRMSEVFEREMQVAMPKEDNYFPIQNTQNDRAENVFVAESLARSSSRAASVQKGMVRSRVHSNAPFRKMSYFNTVTRNIMQVEHYIAYNDAVREVQQFLNHPKISKAMRAKSEDVYEQLKDWVRAVARGKISASDTETDKWFDYVRHSFTTFALGLKLTTGLQQFSSMAKGIAMMDNKAEVAKAAQAFITHPKRAEAFSDSKDPFMKNRQKNYERETAEMMERSVQGQFGMKNQWKKILTGLMWHIGKADKVVCVILWNAKYNEVMKKTGDEQLAIKKARELIRKTQSRGGVLYVPKLYREGGIVRAFTIFTSDINQNVNIAFEMANKWGKRSGERNASEIFWNIMIPTAVIWMVNNALEPAISVIKFAAGDDEPKDWRGEEFIKELVMQYAGAKPFIGPLFNAVAGMVADQIKEARGIIPDKRWKRYVSEIKPAGLEGLENLIQGILELRPRSFFDAISAFAGIPSGALTRMYKGAGRMVEEGSPDIRRLFWSERALREESVFNSMARRLYKPRPKTDDTERYSQWYNTLYPEQKRLFRLYFKEWSKKENEKASKR
jgi:hypothetical protein